MQAQKGRAEGFGGKVFQAEDSAQRTAVLDTLLAVAKEIDVTPSEVAIAWVAAKGSLPIIGPRTLAQLENDLGAICVTLSPEHLARLDAVSAVPKVFPYTVLGDRGTRERIAGGKLDALDFPAEPVA